MKKKIGALVVMGALIGTCIIGELEHTKATMKREIKQLENSNKKLKIKVGELKFNKDKKDKELNDENKKSKAVIKSLNDKVKDLEKKNNDLKKCRISRGGGIINVKKVKVHITFYTDQENDLEGGKMDKQGKELASHDMSVCAMPVDIKYGSILKINGMGTYKVVDTGEAIQWLNDEKTECKVDIFVPGKTTEWLDKYSHNCIKDAILYY